MKKKLLYLQKYSASITVFVVILIQFLLIFQGFDVCDDGFVLTFYQQIFQNPESVEYNFLYWFSGFVGGLWYQLYEGGGILWFRLLAIIINTATFCISYKILKPYLRKELLLSALIMVLFVNDYGFLTYYHNHLTAFMAVSIIYMLNKSVTENSFRLYVLSGILLSVNVFTRIPNLVLFSLVLVIPYSLYLKQQSIIKSIKPIIYIGTGSIVGLLMIFLLLSYLGQIDIMRNALFTINDLGNTENSSHNFKSIMLAPYFNFISIAIETIKLSLIILMLYFLKRFLPKNKIGIFVFFVVTILFLIFWFNTKNIYPVYSICLIGSVVMLLVKKTKYEIKIISFLSLSTLLTIYLGTGGGIKNAGFMGIWIGLPLFFYFVSRFNWIVQDFKFINKKLKLQIHQKTIQIFLWSVIIAFILLKGYNISQEAYFDNGNRFKKTHTINNSLAKGIYTTERRAKIINELLHNLENIVQPNDYLLVYDKMPMIHFLTKTKPYMYNPWVWIYDYNSFKKKLQKAETEIQSLPIVVQQKFETIYEFSEPIKDYMATDKENSNFHSNERNALINDFLRRNKYKIIWSNEYFNIYSPNN
ncbi:hypothetical protein ACPX19_01330 [Winogradskyella sp. HB-48]|uniref:hypothetical protein n=1 Tax=Winogradskyella sp. HB-48 TaxID=3416808 RepID=UPI003CF48392